MKKAVIILGAGSNQILLYETLRRRTQLSLIGVDRNPDAPGFSFCDETITYSTHDADHIIEHLTRLNSNYVFEGVITRSSGPPLVTQSKIAEHFSLPRIPDKAIEVCSRKSNTIAFAHAHGIPAPKQYSLQDLKRDESLFPVMVKPDVTIMGKKNIRKIDKALFLPEKFDFDVEIEQYVNGIDVIGFFIVGDGIMQPLVVVEECVGMKADGEHVGLGLAARHRSLPQCDVIAKQLASAFGIMNGIIFPSCRISSCSVYLIELHFDLGGDYCFDYLLPKAGYNDAILYIIEPFLLSPLGLEPVHDVMRPVAMLYIFFEDCVDELKKEILEKQVGHINYVNDNNKVREGVVLVEIDDNAPAKISAFDRILRREEGMRVSSFFCNNFC